MSSCRVGVAEPGRLGVIDEVECVEVEKEFGVVGRERTVDPNATVGVIERCVVLVRRLSVTEVGVRRPVDETDDFGVLDLWPTKFPVEPVMNQNTKPHHKHAIVFLCKVASIAITPEF